MIIDDKTESCVKVLIVLDVDALQGTVFRGNFYITYFFKFTYAAILQNLLRLFQTVGLINRYKQTIDSTNCKCNVRNVN